MIGAIVNLRDVHAGLRRIGRVDGRRVFRESRRPLRRDIRDHVARQSDADSKWPALASSTRERRSRSRRRRSKRMLGKLPSAISVTSGVDFIRATARPAWAMVHHKGGRAGKGSRIPRRRYMWLSKSLVLEVRDSFSRAMRNAWAAR